MLRDVAAGDRIRFACGDDEVLTRVKEALGVLAIEIELIAD